MHSFCSFQSITRTSPVTSSTSICMYLIFTRKFLTAPTNLTMWCIGRLSKQTFCNPIRQNESSLLWLEYAYAHHCLKYLLQPSCLMAFSCWWNVCHQQIGCCLHHFFSNLVWQTMLPNLIASFQQGTMVLCMRVVPLASISLSKSMRHCSQRSSNVKNVNTTFQWNTTLKEAAIVSKMQTPAITLWFPKHRLKENFYLGFLKEKQLASQVKFLVKSKHWVPAIIWNFVRLCFFLDGFLFKSSF